MVLVQDTDAYTTLVSYNYASIATSEEYFNEARLAGEVLVQAGVIPVL